MVNGSFVTARVWTTPKPDAESGKENEDRVYLSGFRVGEPLLHRITAAVADGASGSLFSREWARELTRMYCRFPGTTSDKAFWEAAVENWEKCIGKQDLPWYLAAKRKDGAQAAFIGVTCCQNGTWNAAAVGDCCLFQRRGDALISAFPLARADDFSLIPSLWSTRALPEQNSAAVSHRAGCWEPGDSLYLMTDACALWCLREIEAERNPWVWLEGIVSDNDFRQRVTILRENRRLRGDDTTVLYLRFADALKESTEDGALADTH